MRGRALTSGVATGEAVVLDEPLSLWGGFDPERGTVVDAHHPQAGVSLSGRVVVMPGGRGSSSSASVLAEAARAGTAPAAFLVHDPDLILTVGAAVASELYGVEIPIVALRAEALARIGPGATVEVRPRGYVRVHSRPERRT